MPHIHIIRHPDALGLMLAPVPVPLAPSPHIQPLELVVVLSRPRVVVHHQLAARHRAEGGGGEGEEDAKPLHVLVVGSLWVGFGRGRGCIAEWRCRVKSALCLLCCPFSV